LSLFFVLLECARHRANCILVGSILIIFSFYELLGHVVLLIECLCYAAIIPSEMFALPDKGKTQEEVKVSYIVFLLQLAVFNN